MIGSSASEYAIRALVYMASRGEELVKLREISEAESIPAPFLSNVLNRLVATGLLRSHRGPTGGYAFARDPGTIRLLDIREAIDGLGDLEACVVGLRDCSDQAPCSVHTRWKPVREEVRRFLTETTLETLVRAKAELPDRNG
jgi:Rrf2 family transcriptional regulator, iron-sulfur cluster assembly transcription factor